MRRRRGIAAARLAEDVGDDVDADHRPDPGVAGLLRLGNAEAGLVGVKIRRGAGESQKPIVDRRQDLGGAMEEVAEHATSDCEGSSAERFRRAIERHGVDAFGDDDMRVNAWCPEAAVDDVGGRRGLNDAVATLLDEFLESILDTHEVFAHMLDANDGLAVAERAEIVARRAFRKRVRRDLNRLLDDRELRQVLLPSDACVLRRRTPLDATRARAALRRRRIGRVGGDGDLFRFDGAANLACDGRNLLASAAEEQVLVLGDGRVTFDELRVSFGELLPEFLELRCLLLVDVPDELHHRPTGRVEGLHLSSDVVGQRHADL